VKQDSLNRRSVMAVGIGFALLGALFIAGCTSPTPPVRVATVPWPPYDLVELDSASSFLDPDLVELVHLQTPAEVVRAFRYELVDVMMVTSHFALSAVSELPDTRIIYFVDVSLGGDALIAQPGIDSAEDLQGKRIGIEAAPLGSYLLTRALQNLGLRKDQILIVEIDTPEHLGAFQRGDVDALVTYDPTRARLIEDGAIQLFGSEQIPYEIIDVVVTRSDVIERRPQALVNLVRAFDAGITAFQANPEEIALRLAPMHELGMGSYLSSLRASELLDLDKNRSLFANPDGPVRRGLLEQCNIMVEQGLLVKTPSLDPLLDATIVERASNRASNR